MAIGASPAKGGGVAAVAAMEKVGMNSEAVGVAGGGQISDPERGRTCHQCRQNNRKLFATCKNLRGCKACAVSYCSNCIFNRYGEKVEDVENVNGWTCPKCRGICNCSKCMKKKGHQPTGALALTAKATGFTSVLEMLQKKGHEGLGNQKVGEKTNDSLEKSLVTKKDVKKKSEESNDLQDKALDKGSKGLTVENDNKDNGNPKNGKVWSTKKLKWVDVNFNANCGNRDNDLYQANADDCPPKLGKKDASTSIKNDAEVDQRKRKLTDGQVKFPMVIKPRKRISTCADKSADDIVLPEGTTLTMAAGLDFLEEDVGPALQFLEFCVAFEKVLGIKKGQPEAILRELIRGRIARRMSQNSLVFQFHIKLLSLIQKDAGGRSLPPNTDQNSWLQALRKCINKTQVPLNLFNDNSFGYDNLDSSKKLRILNFLCDESLGTERIRSWIYDEHVKLVGRKKEDRENTLAAKEKEKNLNPVKDDGHTKAFDKVEASSAKRQKSDAVRTELVSLDESGRAFWRLKGYCNSSRILLQDIQNMEKMFAEDKWFVYNDDQEKIIERHVSSIRNWRLTRHKMLMRNALEDTRQSGVIYSL